MAVSRSRAERPGSAAESGKFVRDGANDRAEQVFLRLEAGVDRLLHNASALGDVVDADAVAFFKKQLARRRKNGFVLRRVGAAPRAGRSASASR